MLSVTLPVCPCVCLSVGRKSCMFLLQRAHFSVYLPTCLPIWWVCSCAFFLPLYIPSLSFCMCCASASAACLSVPCGSHILIDDWRIYWDQSSSAAAGRCPLLPASQHMTVAFKTHTCCQACTCIHCTYTLAGMHEIKVSGRNRGIERAGNKSRVHVWRFVWLLWLF